MKNDDIHHTDRGKPAPKAADARSGPLANANPSKGDSDSDLAAGATMEHEPGLDSEAIHGDSDRGESRPVKRGVTQENAHLAGSLANRSGRDGGLFTSATRVFASLVTSRASWMILVVVVLGWAISQTDYFFVADRLWSHFGMAVVVPFASIHAVVSVSPFPGELIAIHNSMLLGFPMGTLCNWSGWMLAAILQCSLARRLSDELRPMELRTRLPKWMRGWPLDHPAFLVCGRWLPFGGHIVNTSAGVLHVPWRRHLCCSAVSIVPLAVVFAALGVWSRQYLLQD